MNLDSFLSSSLNNLSSMKARAESGKDNQDQAIIEYLYTLTEQLRYMLGHLDEDNFTEGTLQRIVQENDNYASFEMNIDGIVARVGNNENNITELEITANGLRLAQDAAKLQFDSSGLTIKNGGFRIQNSQEQDTFSVTDQGNVNITGTYRSETWRTGGGGLDKLWAEWDGSQINFFYQPDGDDKLRVAAMGVAQGSSGVSSVAAQNFTICTNVNYMDTIYWFTAGKTTNGGIIQVRNAGGNANTVVISNNTYGGAVSIRNASGTEKWRTYVDSSGNGRSEAISSRRYKEDISSMDLDRARLLLDIDFSRFKYKDGDGSWCYGVIAEQLDELGFDDAVGYKDGLPDAVDYTKLIPYMGKMIQVQEARIKELEDKVNGHC